MFPKGEHVYLFFVSTALTLTLTATNDGLCRKSLVGGKWITDGDCSNQNNNNRVIRSLEQKVEASKAAALASTTSVNFRIDRLENLLNKTMSELDGLKRDNTKLKKTLNETTSELDDLIQDNKELKKNLNKTAEYSTSNFIEIDGLKQNNTDLRESLRVTMSELNDLKRSNTNFKEALNRTTSGFEAFSRDAQRRINESEMELSQIFTPSRCYMGMKSGEISDSQITAKTTYMASQSPGKARLDAKTVGDERGGWAAAFPLEGNWIQVDLGNASSVAGIILQGLKNLDQWVETYKVNCDNATVQEVDQGDDSAYVIDKVFIGSKDRTTKAVAKFPTPLNCSVIRILPLTWNWHVAMRFELIKGDCFDLI